MERPKPLEDHLTSQIASNLAVWGKTVGVTYLVKETPLRSLMLWYGPRDCVFVNVNVVIRMSNIRPRNQIVMANSFPYFNCVIRIFYWYQGTDKSFKTIPVLWAYLMGKAKINP